MSTQEISMDGADAACVNEIIARLADDDIFGQLLSRTGKMSELAMEGGEAKLAWVDGVELALAHPEWLAAAEQEALDIVNGGIRRIIWSGMGGSVQTIYALKRCGFLDRDEMAIFPLDSTDPASLNRVFADVAHSLDIDVTILASDREAVRKVLEQTMMIGVSMGMTSEEPITHLEWFDGLLRESEIARPADHIQVMTLPGSYLDQFAKARNARTVPIQLDGGNLTGGRFSAPTTRVFIRPVALMLMAAARSAAADSIKADGSHIRPVLERCQDLYAISAACDETSRRSLVRADSFVRLGAFIANEDATRGRNQVLFLVPPEWRGVEPWVEQIVEESLGKGGKGFLIFYGETPVAEQMNDRTMVWRLKIDGADAPYAAEVAALQSTGVPVLDMTLGVCDTSGAPRGLAEVTGLFANMKKTVATYGYLRDVIYAGQPAVEAYKKYARDLREAPAPVTFPTGGEQAHFEGLTLDYSSLTKLNLLDAAALTEIIAGFGGDASDAADVYAAILLSAQSRDRLRYGDITFNGELIPALESVLRDGIAAIFYRTLHIRAKLRTGPSDYHSTEQSETDGPPELVSLRLVARQHDPITVGSYSDKFLLAQARGTWQAMEDAGRWILMITFDRLDGETIESLRRFFARVEARLAATR